MLLNVAFDQILHGLPIIGRYINKSKTCSKRIQFAPNGKQIVSGSNGPVFQMVGKQFERFVSTGRLSIPFKYSNRLSRTNKSINQSIDRLIYQVFNRSVGQSVHQIINQSIINQFSSHKRLINRLVDLVIDRLVGPSNNQSVNQTQTILEVLLLYCDAFYRIYSKCSVTQLITIYTCPLFVLLFRMP